MLLQGALSWSQLGVALTPQYLEVRMLPLTDSRDRLGSSSVPRIISSGNTWMRNLIEYPSHVDATRWSRKARAVEGT